eukprot:CCRYP_013293-RE/>CCRYP_013293-RE protein AED:0.57 eAED:0.57 QI:0/-1/0/1/-1/0/1/0/249
MVLAAHNDASCLSETNARSHAGGHFFLSENEHYPTNNGAVLTIVQIIKTIMSSAAEAELGALYMNAREVTPLRHLLIEMVHPQPPPPIQIDNSMALGVVNNTIQPKCTKATDMRFHWLHCRINQQHFRPYWHAGATNLADYVTKHHPAIHHQAVRPLFLTADHPLLPHWIPAPCIPRNTLMRTPPSDQLQAPHNSAQIWFTPYHCKGVLCIQYVHILQWIQYFTCLPHYLHSGTALELYLSAWLLIWYG